VELDLSTAPEQRSESSLWRGRILRWVFALALTAFLVVGLLGGYGVRHRGVTGVGGGYELTVRFPTVTRPGLASVWAVEVRRTDGAPLEGPITIATDAAYFELFDENGLDPDPATAMSDGERLIWEVEPADRATAVALDFDARIEPAVQLTRERGETSVLVDGEPVVTVTYTTNVLP
jgi:hypothetical protein